MSDHRKKSPPPPKSNPESGNVFTVLLAAVALSGVLSVVVYQQLSGPLSTAVRLNNKVSADTQMLAVSRIAILDASNQASSGDCDADTFIEPRAWATGTAKPVNGGNIPTAMGAPTTDPWGTPYGYCVWDTGSFSNPAVNNGCGAGVNRLTGAPDPGIVAANLQTLIAIVSAGPDRAFNTTCYNYSTTTNNATHSTTNLLATTGDDVVNRYSYNEAVQIGGYMSLKAGDPDTATTEKNIETSGFLQATAITVTPGKIMAVGGVQLGDETDVLDAVCTAGTVGLMRYHATDDALQICLSNGGSPDWEAAGGDGGGGNIHAPVTDAAVNGAACTVLGALATDVSGNLLTCDTATSTIRNASCASIGTGAFTFDPKGNLHACLN